MNRITYQGVMYEPARICLPSGSSAGEHLEPLDGINHRRSIVINGHDYAIEHHGDSLMNLMKNMVLDMT